MDCLESLGYRILAASSGRSTIEMLDKHPDVELLMVDIAMPEMNGIEVAHAVSAKRPELPIIYMTGYVGSSKFDGSGQRNYSEKAFHSC